MKNFILINKLKTDISRPVSDMAAFYGYTPAAEAEVSLTISAEREQVTACLRSSAQSFTASEPCSAAAASGELARCVKLAVLDVFFKLTGARPELP